MRTAIITTLILAALLAAPAISAEQFKDVPKDHWAAEYVAQAASDGVIKGYPDATFKGNKPVTRYELAVALERMIEVIENSLKPEANKQPAAATPPPQTAPAKEAVKNPKPKADSQDPAQSLKQNGYIAADSPLLTNREKAVSSAELAQALSSVAAKLIEKTIPPPKD